MTSVPTAVPTFAERLEDARARLTPAERRVAEAVAGDRELVAFGTVSAVAERAGVGGASVVRLAGRLGYDGFRGMQDGLRDELSARLRPATEKIRLPAPDDLVGRAGEAAVASVQRTFARVDLVAFDRVVRALAARGRAVFVVCGDASTGLGVQFCTQLSMLRPGVTAVGGSEVAVGRLLAEVVPGDVLVAVDLRRYDRWVLDTVDRAARHGADVVAVSDSPVSPLTAVASTAFVVDAEGPGPFDSYVGALALLDALVAGVAARLRGPARDHLDRIEAAWAETEALDPGP